MTIYCISAIASALASVSNIIIYSLSANVFIVMSLLDGRGNTSFSDSLSDIV